MRKKNLEDAVMNQEGVPLRSKINTIREEDINGMQQHTEMEALMISQWLHWKNIERRVSIRKPYLRVVASRFCLKSSRAWACNVIMDWIEYVYWSPIFYFIFDSGHLMPRD